MRVIPIVIGALGTIPKGLVKGLEKLEIRGQMKTTIVEIGKNIEKISVDVQSLKLQWNAIS